MPPAIPAKFTTSSLSASEDFVGTQTPSNPKECRFTKFPVFHEVTLNYQQKSVAGEVIFNTTKNIFARNRQLPDLAPKELVRFKKTPIKKYELNVGSIA